MFKFENLKCIHIEVTSRCQASCPMCNRNLYGGLKNPRLTLADWTLEDFQTIINEEVLENLYQIMFCGHFGDPLINPHFLDMIKYLKEVNPNIMVNLHTNGSFYKEDWWTELAQSLPTKHQVHIGIDGLEDTHSLYRLDTNWAHIIRNAKAFIAAGGNAVWKMIKFDHNAHQVDECRTMASELGFIKFDLTDHSRSSGSVFDRQGNRVYQIGSGPSHPTTDTVIKWYDKYIEDDWMLQKTEKNSLSCYSQQSKSIYVTANGEVYPCCYLGFRSEEHTSELQSH